MKNLTCGEQRGGTLPVKLVDDKGDVVFDGTIETRGLRNSAAAGSILIGVLAELIEEHG